MSRIAADAAEPSRGVADADRHERSVADLASVLDEIGQLMEASAAFLTQHPANGGAPFVVQAEPATLASREVATRALTNGLAECATSGAPGPAWIACRIGARQYDVLALRIDPLPEHSQLMIGVIFHQPNDTIRARAEQLYRERRPFAVGYFRLWQLERTCQRRIAALESACNATDIGVLMLTLSGRVIFENAVARGLLDENDGLRRTATSVQAWDLRDGVKLQVAVNHVIALSQGGEPVHRAPLMRLQRPKAKPLVVAVVPAGRRPVEPSDPAAFLYLFDPSFDAERLLNPICRLFNLSPVETRLACLLAEGLSVAQTAAQLSIKEQTARSYLKQIFLKTDTRRQSELIHLMLSNIVRLGRPITPELF